MKKLNSLLSIFVMVAAFSATVNAQNQDVEVSAVVQATLTYSGVTNVTFGAITASTAAVLPANGSSSLSASNSTNATTGSATITGSAGVGVTISYNTGVTLGDGTNSAAFTPDVYTTGGTEIEQTGTSVNLSGASGTGSVTLDIGGTVAAISVAGTYTTDASNGTDLTLTVAYD